MFLFFFLLFKLNENFKMYKLKRQEGRREGKKTTPVLDSKAIVSHFLGPRQPCWVSYDFPACWGVERGPWFLANAPLGTHRPELKLELW